MLTVSWVLEQSFLTLTATINFLIIVSMYKFLPKSKNYLLLISIFVLFSVGKSFALETNTAFSLQLKDNIGNAGDIVTYKDGQYSISAEKYDTQMFGVIVDKPITSL